MNTTHHSFYSFIRITTIFICTNIHSHTYRLAYRFICYRIWARTIIQSFTHQLYTIPLTCKVAVYLISAAGLVATHVYSPVCVAEREGILRRELYWSKEVTLAPNTGGNGSPSLSQRSESGASPRETPHTVRVRIPSARPSWKEKGSIIGGTGKQEIERRNTKCQM